MIKMYIISAILAALLSIIVRRWHNFTTKQATLIIVLASISGILGTYVFWYIENGDWGGCRAYGCCLLMLPVMLIVLKLMKMPYNESFDIIAAPTTVMIGIGKLNCVVQGCCSGMYIESLGITFPSAIVETIIPFITAFVLFGFLKHKKFIGKLEPITFIVYGITRILADFLREEVTHFAANLSLAIYSSSLIILIGIVWIIIVEISNKKNKNNELKEKSTLIKD